MINFKEYLSKHHDTFDKLQKLDNKISEVSCKVAKTIKSGGKIFFCGNGGSAADSQHLAAEFVGRFINDRPPLPSFALTTDTSILTSIGNDYSFDDVFSRQLLALGSERDLLIVLSTSGNSKNIIEVINTAKKMNLFVVGMFGKGGGRGAPLCNLSIIIESSVTARIQEAHMFLGHYICESVEIELGHA